MISYFRLLLLNSIVSKHKQTTSHARFLCPVETTWVVNIMNVTVTWTVNNNNSDEQKSWMSTNSSSNTCNGHIMSSFLMELNYSMNDYAVSDIP